MNCSCLGRKPARSFSLLLDPSASWWAVLQLSGVCTSITIIAIPYELSPVLAYIIIILTHSWIQSPLGKDFHVSCRFQIFWIFLLRGNAYSLGTFSISSITDLMSAFFSLSCLFSVPNDPGLLVSALGIPLLCTLSNSVLPFQCHNSPQFSRSGCALDLMTCHDSALLVAVPWFLILYFLVRYCLFSFPPLPLSSKMILQTRLQTPDTYFSGTHRQGYFSSTLAWVCGNEIRVALLVTHLPVIMRSFYCALHEAPALTEHTILLANLMSPPWLSHFRELKDVLKRMATMVILKTPCMEKSSMFSYL